MAADIQVSIVVPCFNQRRVLARAIDSVRLQTLQSWECVIVDDGSTDESASIAARFAEADPRIRCVSQRNRGVSAARNLGLDACAGRFIQFLDADDSIHPEKLARQLQALKAASSPAVCICDYEFRDDTTGKRFRRGSLDKPRFTDDPWLQVLSDWETDLSFPPNALLIDERLLNAPRLRFNEHLGSHEDWDLWIRLFAKRPEIFQLHAPLATYFIHDSGLSADVRRMATSCEVVLGTQIEASRGQPLIRQTLVRKRAEMRRWYRRRRQQAGVDRMPIAIQNLVRKLPWPLQRMIRALIAL
jgi:hypothetical protein